MYKKILSYDTGAKSEFRTITDDVRDCIQESGIENGTLLIYSMHTTMGVAVQETSEPNLCRPIISPCDIYLRKSFLILPRTIWRKRLRSRSTRWMDIGLP